MSTSLIDKWHALVKSRNADALDALLAEDVVFHSPVVHAPQRGHAITRMYLTAAVQVLMNDSFRYVREIHDARVAMLEFELELEGIHINGVDIIAWNDQDQITDFKVMIRPLKAINLIHQQMGAMLQAMKR